MSRSSKRRTFVSWGRGETRVVGCDMAEVVAWMPAAGGWVEVVMRSGARVTLPLSVGDFAAGHAVGMGYEVEKPPAQTEMNVDQPAKEGA